MEEYRGVCGWGRENVVGLWESQRLGITEVMN